MYDLNIFIYPCLGKNAYLDKLFLVTFLPLEVEIHTPGGESSAGGCSLPHRTQRMFEQFLGVFWRSGGRTGSELRILGI